MTEIPDVPDILATVRDFLEGLAPTLEKGAKFEAQVAIYLLDIARRQVAAPAKAEADATKLCRDIRSGTLDGQWDEVLDAELAAVTGRVRIVRPEYLDGVKS